MHFPHAFPLTPPTPCRSKQFVPSALHNVLEKSLSILPTQQIPKWPKNRPPQKLPKTEISKTYKTLQILTLLILLKVIKQV